MTCSTSCVPPALRGGDAHVAQRARRSSCDRAWAGAPPRRAGCAPAAGRTLDAPLPRDASICAAPWTGRDPHLLGGEHRARADRACRGHSRSCPATSRTSATSRSCARRRRRRPHHRGAFVPELAVRAHVEGDPAAESHHRNALAARWDCLDDRPAAAALAPAPPPLPGMRAGRESCAFHGATLRWSTPHSTSIARKSLTLVCVGPVTTRSPSALK